MIGNGDAQTAWQLVMATALLAMLPPVATRLLIVPIALVALASWKLAAVPVRDWAVSTPPGACVTWPVASSSSSTELAPKAPPMTIEPAMVVGDRDELLRVAENLIENAIKYGARGDSEAAGVVEVAVSMTEKEGSLSVRDYGYGIAPEHLPRLTERFYRVDAAQSRAKNGTGLGLAIVKHILTRHRGRLTITSRVNQGSSFVAMVPLQQKTKP